MIYPWTKTANHKSQGNCGVLERLLGDTRGERLLQAFTAYRLPID